MMKKNLINSDNLKDKKIYLESLILSLEGYFDLETIKEKSIIEYNNTILYIILYELYRKGLIKNCGDKYKVV